MLHSFNDCQGDNVICEFLTSIFEEADDDEVVSFKQWIKNEKFTNLPTFQLLLSEFIDGMCSQLVKLQFHHYVSKVQAGLKDFKDYLKDDECIVLLDVADNYLCCSGCCARVPLERFTGHITFFCCLL